MHDVLDNDEDRFFLCYTSESFETTKNCSSGDLQKSNDYNFVHSTDFSDANYENSTKYLRILRIIKELPLIMYNPYLRMTGAL